MKLRDLKHGKIKFKMHGKYPAAYIAKTKKRKALKRHHKKGGE